MSFDHVALTGEQARLLRPLNGKRATVRYKCGLATPGRVQLEGQEWQRVWLLNLSLGGAGLLVSRPLEPGLEVVVHLTASAQNLTYEVAARICHATQRPDGEWVVGCEFANQLTADQLEALLQ